MIPAPEHPSVNDLPNELLVQIFEYIPSSYNERCKHLSSVTRVNRRFRSITTPLLYWKFHACCARHLKLFGRTILSNDYIAELVKHYEGRRTGTSFSSHPDECPRVWHEFVLDQELDDSVRKRVADLPTPMTRSIFSYSIARALPRLQRLDVTNSGNQLIRILADADLHGQVSLQQLRALTIAVEPDRSYRMHDLSLLFTLPCLQTLSIETASLNEEEEHLEQAIDCSWRCQVRTSTIQELTLMQCGLPAIWISKMIESCRILRIFEQEHFHWDTSTEHISQILQALTLHQDTLFGVRMNELNGCKVVSMRQSDPPQPISFQHFTSLTHLDVPLFVFCTRTKCCPIDTLLPLSLQVLTLDVRSAREGPSDKFFISVAEFAKNRLSALTSIEIMCRIEEYREHGSLPLHFCHLRRLLSTCGVELIYCLDFVSCEFKAAYMEPMLTTMRLSGKDGHELADHSFLEAGCLKDSYMYASMDCDSRSTNAYRSKKNWGYMEAWTGPEDSELLS